MTDSPSEPATEEVAANGEAPEAAAAAAATDELASFAARLAEIAGATSWATDHDTVRLVVDRERWVEAVGAVGDELPFFSWLSAVDWSRQVAVGEPADSVDELEERYDVLCRLSSVTNADGVVLVTSVPKDDASIDSLVPRFGGAEWHEREAAEMFGIEFHGHPNLAHLYLPDAFEGHPLRKSYALLSREVKPWPGTVDVEDMPSTENVEAEAGGNATSDETAGEGGDDT